MTGGAYQSTRLIMILPQLSFNRGLDALAANEQGSVSKTLQLIFRFVEILQQLFLSKQIKAHFYLIVIPSSRRGNSISRNDLPCILFLHGDRSDVDFIGQIEQCQRNRSIVNRAPESASTLTQYRPSWLEMDSISWFSDASRRLARKSFFLQQFMPGLVSRRFDGYFHEI